MEPENVFFNIGLGRLSSQIPGWRLEISRFCGSLPVPCWAVDRQRLDRRLNFSVWIVWSLCKSLDELRSNVKKWIWGNVCAAFCRAYGEISTKTDFCQFKDEVTTFAGALRYLLT